MRNVITTGDVPLGGVLEVLCGTIVTPSARELARDRGVPIVEVAPEQYARAKEPHRTVAIGSDHGGFRMKEFLKGIVTSLGYAVEDCGAFDERSVDYPDLAARPWAMGGHQLHAQGARIPEGTKRALHALLRCA